MAKIQKTCATCGAGLLRHEKNPNTGRPIANFFCNTTCKGDWQRAQREALGFTREWLIDQYITQQKDANRIGREIGRDGKRVWEWLRDYGIETRKRGSNSDQLPKDGSATRGMRHSDKTRARLREIALADGRVPWGKANEPYWKGKTGSAHPTFKGGLTPERQNFYSSPEWAEAVNKVWARDNAKCQHCGKHHNQAEVRGTFHIHHIVSFMVRELRAEVSNLVLLCAPCHRWVHSRKNTEGLFLKHIEQK